MIATGVEFLASELERTEQRAAVPAGVEEATDFTVAILHDNDRLATDVCGEEAVCLGQLGFQPDEEPCPFKDGRHLRFEYRFVGEYRAVDGENTIRRAIVDMRSDTREVCHDAALEM